MQDRFFQVFRVLVTITLVCCFVCGLIHYEVGLLSIMSQFGKVKL